MYFPDFDALLGKRAEIDSTYGRQVLSVKTIGDLFLPSGPIVACDALVQLDAKPFTRRLAPGRYPVYVTISRLEGGDERIASAFLRHGAKEPTRWEMAVVPGQDVASLGEDGYFGYAVDSGTGCFESAEAHRALNKKFREDENYWERITAEMQKHYVHTRNWADYLIDAATGLNAVVFSTGMGDGLYGSYWGFDDASDVCVLVTDFGVI